MIKDKCNTYRKYCPICPFLYDNKLINRSRCSLYDVFPFTDVMPEQIYDIWTKVNFLPGVIFATFFTEIYGEKNEDT